MLSSTDTLSEAQRGRILATHVQLIDENQQLRAMLAASNIGVERIVAQLRNVHSARKRPASSPPNVSRKRKREFA